MKSFREACPETPVVAVTNLASAGDEAALKAAGATACLGKPFDIDQLLGVLESVIRPRRPAHPVLSDAELDALLAPDDEPDMGL